MEALVVTFKTHASQEQFTAATAEHAPVFAELDGLTNFADVRLATVERANVAPPSVERMLSIEPVNPCSPAYAPATVTSAPSGRTCGCVPMSTPVARTGADHVTPPSSLHWLVVSVLSSSV